MPEQWSKPPKQTWWDKFLDIASGKRFYTMPVNRRRTEMCIVGLAALVSIGVVIDQGPGAYIELGGKDCPRTPADSIRILITDLEDPNNENTYLETRLEEELSRQMPEKTVCRYKQILENSPSNTDFGNYRPSIVVWGGELDEVLIITISVVEWPDLVEEISVIPEEQTDFHIEGIKQIPFLANYIVSKMFFIDGEVEKARQKLQGVLDDAEGQAWVENKPEVLANGYLLLADINTFISV